MTVVFLQSKMSSSERGEVADRLSSVQLTKHCEPSAFSVIFRKLMGSAARRSAKGKPCSLRLIGCTGGMLDGTTVLAHVRTTGVGVGRKPHDSMAVYACGNCHDVIDGRAKTRMMEKEIQERIIAGLAETHSSLIDSGAMILK